ncbi:hypothetical protein B0H12DRAFT_1169516, partial [Mycena haematopus]
MPGGPTANDPNVAHYGFTAVPRDPDVLFKDHPTASGNHPKQDPFTVKDFPVPESALVNQVRDFVKKELDLQTFNHSNRVYVYGAAIVKTHFPEWTYDNETWYLACILHDIGTAEKFLATTKMSFEFKGVCDAIVRHQDIFVKGTGNITQIGQASSSHHPRYAVSILDNVGLWSSFPVRSHPSNLIETTVAAFPRLGWSEHFARVVEKELHLKPWCHTSTFEIPAWTRGTPAISPP